MSQLSSGQTGAQRYQRYCGDGIRHGDYAWCHDLYPESLKDCIDAQHVSPNGGFHKGGPPKWMVHKFIKEHPMKVDDFGVPLFQATPSLSVPLGKASKVYSHKAQLDHLVQFASVMVYPLVMTNSLLLQMAHRNI